MKYTIGFILVLFFFSCGVENHNTSLNEITNTSKRTTTYTEFEGKMQWASYLAAMVLEENEDARIEFTNLIDGQNKIISFKDIFTDPVKTASIAPEFQNQFMIYLGYYSLFVCQAGKPENVPIPPTATENPACVAYFLNYIINDNCLEFYFPNDLDFTPVLPITSTGHPLTQVDNNYGFKRQQQDLISVIVTEEVINPEYLITNNNIIVTRPINGVTVECDYSEFEIDFTLFLNN